MRKAILILPLVLFLAACGGQSTTPGEQVEAQPVPKAEQTTATTTEDSGGSSGGLCMPCVGPHINLSTGRFSVFSIGPGFGF